ncbi:MAG: hypothetical protein OHK0045_11620 [Raineya sp.]
MLASCQENKFDPKPFFAQVASKSYVITQIELPEEGKIISDTSKKAYNAQKRLIVENENVFFRYDSTGKLSEKIVCIAPDCEKIITWQYEYQKEKMLVRQFRDGKLQQIQEISPFKKQNISKVNDSAYTFLEQEHHWQENKLTAGKYKLFWNDTKTSTFLEQNYQYDSLGKLVQIVRIPDKDSSSCVKIAFLYNPQGKLSKSLHSRFMPFAEDIKTYIDHYKTYAYDTAGRLVEVKTFKQGEKEKKAQSITRYFYIQL